MTVFIDSIVISKQGKLDFIAKHHIDFIDLIAEIEVDAGQEANYDDPYIDSRVFQWRDITFEIDKLINIERVCFTRKTFSDIPNMKKRVGGRVAPRNQLEHPHFRGAKPCRIGRKLFQQIAHGGLEQRQCA